MINTISSAANQTFQLCPQLAPKWLQEGRVSLGRLGFLWGLLLWAHSLGGGGKLSHLTQIHSEWPSVRWTWKRLQAGPD